ncbi:xanthine dehydrogenase accessory protein XdhC [Vreelandella profundi]|uniref:xanthine dehydrogenase accessory protein XdhC n=1 Tax=Vreelandella profundi TaxID=2852117 RepID=UPI001EEFB9B6|nr:xanthine dehydrogenase accessory protein XdhC [Halomonas profundi]
MTLQIANTWHAALDYFQRTGTPHVLATQVTSAGSTPREPGARMIITADAIFDTLGGGTFEWQTIAAARTCLAEQRYGLSLEAFSLGGRSGQCCGGFVNILLETFPGSVATLAVFGAGHVGREIVKLSAPLPWQLYWYDSRSDAFENICKNTQQHPRLTYQALHDPQQCVPELSSCTHALVLTHHHDEDYALIAALIQRDDLGSIGLIGSESKWASFRGRLQRDGFTAEQIQRVRSPIGCLHGKKLSNKTPYAIALTAITELLWLADTPSPQDTRGLDPQALRTLLDESSTATS